MRTSTGLSNVRRLVMQFTKKRLITIGVILLFIFVGLTYRLPYYIYQPGLADDLKEIVQVEGGHQSEGSLHLVTVSGGQATPFDFLVAKIFPYHEIVPIEEARPEGITDEEYMEHQLFLMENSQHAAMVVAYEAAGEKVELISNGVYVIQVIEGMPAEGKVQAGDRITAVDDIKVDGADDLVKYVQNKQAGDQLQITIVRSGETIEKQIEISSYKEEEEKVGIGIKLVTDEQIEVEPNMTFHSGKIGGPSAGLMFSLEIYNQLTERDITKGLNIVGTGEIDYDGNVHRIGGIDKKVVAADNENADIFLAPYEKGKKNSNYEVAKETAEKINSDMKIVPVDSFQDALSYLNDLNTTS